MVSRSTFYSHFSDKYELLSYALDEKIRTQMAEEQNQTLENQLTALLRSVQLNRRAFRNVFMADLTPELVNIFQRTLNTAAVSSLKELQQSGTELPGEIEFIAAFCVGGLSNVIMGWIMDNCSTPAEEIAACQWRLLSALGVMEAGKKKTPESIRTDHQG